MRLNGKCKYGDVNFSILPQFPGNCGITLIYNVYFYPKNRNKNKYTLYKVFDNYLRTSESTNSMLMLTDGFNPKRQYNYESISEMCNSIPGWSGSKGIKNIASGNYIKVFISDRNKFKKKLKTSLRIHKVY